MRSHIYVNGTLWASQKEGAQDNNPETPVLIGALLAKGNPLDFFDGVVDEVSAHTLVSPLGATAVSLGCGVCVASIAHMWLCRFA